MDTSQFRQNTYGPPNRYCDPTRALNNAGAGTLASPWNMSQAMNAVAGDIVGWLPGNSVLLEHGIDTRTPAFNPVNSGTAASPIVHVTQYAAVLLADPFTDATATKLRHNGTEPQITGGGGESGTGSAIIGTNMRSYVIYDGFALNMEDCWIRGDSGMITCRECSGVEFHNLVMRGPNRDVTVGSNCVMYRPNNAVNTVLENIEAYRFHNDPTGSATPQPALFSDQYGDQNYTLRHLYIHDMDRGIFQKGTANAGTTFNYGTVEFCHVDGCQYGIAFNDNDPSHLTTVRYCLFSNCEWAAVAFTNETSPARQILIDHCTCTVVNTSANGIGAFYHKQGNTGNTALTNNLMWQAFGGSATFARLVAAEDNTSPMPAMSYNGYYAGGYAGNKWSYNGNGSISTLAAWQSATGQDANSQLLTTSPFTNPTAGDFTIVAGSPALTGSSTGGQLGCYAGPETVGLDTGTTPVGGPTFLSATGTTFTVGTAGSFSVVAVSSVTSITRSGALPSGVTYTDNANGTGTLAGTAATGTQGSYPLVFTATNSGGSTPQNFTLAVNAAPSGGPPVPVIMVVLQQMGSQ